MSDTSQLETIDNKQAGQNKLYETPVDLKLVNFKVIKNWISETINKIIPDDDIIVDYIEELLYDGDYPSIKDIEIQLNSFLGDESKKFCKQLWKLLISAQNDKDGIPKQLIEKKRKEREREVEKKNQSKNQGNTEDQRHSRQSETTIHEPNVNEDQKQSKLKEEKRKHGESKSEPYLYQRSKRSRSDRFENQSHKNYTREFKLNDTNSKPHKIRGKYNVTSHQRQNRYKETSRDESQRDRSPRR